MHDWGKTALMFAAENGDTEVVRELLAAGADVYRNYDDKTALILATEKGHTEIIDLLNEYGAGRSWMQRHGNKLLGAGVVGVGLMFGVGYVFPALGFGTQVAVSIASACMVLFFAYGIDSSSQAAYKAEVLAKHKGQHVSSGDMAASANAAPVSGMGNAADETVQLGDSDTDAKKPGEKKP